MGINKQKRIFSIFVFVMMYVLLFWHFKYDLAINKYSCLENVELVAYNDLEKRENGYIINGEDAYIVYHLEEAISSPELLIKFNDKFGENAVVQIFYSDTDALFCQEDSVWITEIDGTNIIGVHLPKEQIAYVRVDVGEGKGDVGIQFNFDNIIVDNYTSLVANAFLSYGNYLLLLLCISLSLGIYKMYKQISNLLIKEIAYLKKHSFICFILILICIILQVFKDYILGTKLYIFTDIAMDSIKQTYPQFINIVYRIQNEIWGSWYNFYQGLGNADSSLKLNFSDWMCLLGDNYLEYFMGINQCIIVLLSGLFAYLFSKIYGNSNRCSMIVGLCYAFSAPIIIRGAWKSYPSLSLHLMIWLTAYELSLKKKNNIFLPIATVVYFYICGIYDKVLWVSLFAAYILFREKVDGESNLKNIVKKELFLIFCVMLACMDSFIMELIKVLSSSRFNNGTMKFMENGWFASDKLRMTAFLRTISCNIIGIDDDYCGSLNYLEAPAFYCGILIFMVIPLALYNMSKKKQIWYLALVIAAIIYICINPFRYIMNGFAGDTYKLSSNWIIIIMLLLFMNLGRKIETEKELKKGSQWFFNFTSLCIIITLIAARTLGYVSRIQDYAVVVVLVCAYSLIINICMIYKERRHTLINLLCLLTIVEVVLVPWNSINDRGVVTRKQLENAYYNDGTAQAAQYIKSLDNSFYRIHKDYMESWCDSLAQGYYGDASYVGGTEIGQGVLNIYDALYLEKSNNHFLLGTGTNIYADSLLSIKYLLTKKDTVVRYGFEYLAQCGDIKIYKNKHALPVAYAYDQTIQESDFFALPYYDRNKNILESCIVSDNEFMIEEINMDNCDIAEKDITIDENKRYRVYADKGNIVILNILCNKNIAGSIFLSDRNGNTVSEYVSLLAGKNKYIEVYMDDFSEFWFNNEIQDDIIVESVYKANADDYYARTVENISKLQANALNIEEQDYNYFKGNINCDSNMILATSIPVDDKWHIKIDGNESEVITVNTGFIGTKISKGVHDVEIYYDSNSWFSENKFFLLGFFSSIVYILYSIRKKYLIKTKFTRGDNNGEIISGSTSI